MTEFLLEIIELLTRSAGPCCCHAAQVRHGVRQRPQLGEIPPQEHSGSDSRGAPRSESAAAGGRSSVGGFGNLLLFICFSRPVLRGGAVCGDKSGFMGVFLLAARPQAKLVAKEGLSRMQVVAD